MKHPGPLLAFTFALASCVSAPHSRPTTSDYDVVITGGRIVDGMGNAWYYGDVGVRGDRIVAITQAGALASANTRTRLDAHGLVVAPGFIDIQGHSREALIAGDSRLVGKVTQGVTTEIMGEGWTNAPANALTTDSTDSTSLRDARLFGGAHGFAAWLAYMQTRGSSVNFGSFVGHQTIREYAMGQRNGDASPAELDTMRAVTRHAMEDGAFGVASALAYSPGIFARTDEVAEVVKASAPYGGVYITHLRSEADRYLEALDEAMEIGRRAGVPVEIYHMKAAGQRNWSKGPLAVAKIDSARAAGQDVGATMYPYVAGATTLTACFPPWAQADGKLLSNLADSATRARIAAEVAQPIAPGWENFCQLATPSGTHPTGLETPAMKPYEGKSLTEIGAARGTDWVQALIDVTLAEKGKPDMTIFLASEENLDLQMRKPWVVFGTDAGGFDPDSIHSLEHPRAFGQYPRILGHYVRDEHLFTLEEAIRKMTSAVAERLSIPDRGALRVGEYADITIFDPATISDRATYEQPNQLSVGVREVLVNGVLVLHDGKVTGAKPGRALHGPGWTGAR